MARKVIHPWPLRMMHWPNAVAIITLIGSGWEIGRKGPLYRVPLRRRILYRNRYEIRTSYVDDFCLRVFRGTADNSVRAPSRLQLPTKLGFKNPK